MSDLLARYARLYSSLVSDCVEAAGLGPRCAAPGLAPFHTDPLRVAVGWAHTADVRRTTERVEIDALLDMVAATPDESVVVVATDEDVQGALWGGLMTAGVQARGARGAVVDGGIRDMHQVVPLDFPVWATYRSPLDIRGRAEVVGHGTPVKFRGVDVDPGDLVFADANGVVFVPAHAAEDVLKLAEERQQAEQQTEAELAEGADPSDVYNRLGAF
jgi:4-hydroxy-4-methyl-2-oxoglutarate aldolase